MIIAALSALLFLIYILIKKYNSLALANPALWFAIGWTASITSYMALDAVGGVPVHAPEILKELMISITITAVFFVSLNLFLTPSPSFKYIVSDRTPTLFPKNYKLFALVSLVGALINFVSISFTMGYDDSVRQQWLQEIPRVTVYTWYLYLMNFPAAILSGQILVRLVQSKDRILSRRNIYIALPILNGYLWSMSTGGRQALGIVIFHCVVGACLAIASLSASETGVPKKAMKKLAIISVVGFIGFSLFIGLTGLSRAKQQGTIASEFDDIWFVAPVGQLINYVGLSIASQQAYGEPQRRDLTETGPVSLAGFQKFGLRYITDWRPLNVDDTNPERALSSTGIDLASATRNVFYDFQADFGLNVARAVLMLIAILSHLLFLRAKYFTSETLTKSVPLTILIIFWGYSHQFSILMFDTFFWTTVSCLIWDFSRRFKF